MREMTEAQAQELANLLGMWIVAMESGPVKACEHKPSIGYDKKMECSRWYMNGCAYYIPVAIGSVRPWNEQIWRPQE